MARKDHIAKIRKLILDIISFNTPQVIVFNLSMILIILAIVPTSALVYSPVKCVFKNVILPAVFDGDCPETGIFAGCECPACGMTRAMSRLLHGDLAGAWDYNPLVFAVFFMMVWMVAINSVRSYRRIRKARRIRKTGSFR